MNLRILFHWEISRNIYKNNINVPYKKAHKNGIPCQLTHLNGVRLIKEMSKSRKTYQTHCILVLLTPAMWNKFHTCCHISTYFSNIKKKK